MNIEQVKKLKTLRGIDLTGLVFERLTVLGKGEKANQGQTRWICQCTCGKRTVVAGRALKNGKSKSCGCYGLDKTIRTCTTHGMWKTREYKIWQGLKDRCLNKNCPVYAYYGGRGIKICDRWVNSFANFYEDMGLSNGLSIDRYPDNNGDYSPANCRWATMKEQCSNRRPRGKNKSYIRKSSNSHISKMGKSENTKN